LESEKVEGSIGLRVRGEGFLGLARVQRPRKPKGRSLQRGRA